MSLHLAACRRTSILQLWWERTRTRTLHCYRCIRAHWAGSICFVRIGRQVPPWIWLASHLEQLLEHHKPEMSGGAAFEVAASLPVPRPLLVSARESQEWTRSSQLWALTRLMVPPLLRPLPCWLELACCSPDTAPCNSQPLALCVSAARPGLSSVL